MKRFLIILAALLVLPLTASAVTVGWTYNSATNNIQPYPSINTTASTSVLSANTFCLTADTCRTTWPSGGSSASSTLLIDNNTFSGINSFTNSSSNFAGTLGGDSLATILSSAFSTTSASYFLSLNQGNAFSTTSANYLLSTKGYLTSAVTNVGAVYPLSSTGGTTPVISSATSSGTSAGVLSAADWSRFNTASSTFTSPLVYTNSTNAVTCPTCYTGTPPTYTGFTPISVSASNVIAISTSSASVAGFLSSSDYMLLHGATSTFSSPLIYTNSTNAVTLQAASASQNGYLALADYSLLHTATTTFSGPLVYTNSTNAVTCPTCGPAWPFTASTWAGTSVQATSTPIWLKATTPFSLMATSSYITYASSTAETTTNLFATYATTTAVSATNGYITYASTTETDATTFCLGGTCKTAWPSGSGISWPWTALTNWGTSTVATTTAYTAPAYFASSTLASQFPYATSTTYSTGTLCLNGTCKSVWPAGTVTSVTGSAPIFSSGGATPNITWFGISTSTNLVANQVLFASAANTTAGNTAFTFNPTGTLFTATNASTTNFTAGSSNPFNIYANGEAVAYDLLTGNVGQVSPMRYLSFQLSTSTAWTASSSASSVYGDEAQVVMPFAGTMRTLACATNAGTLEIESSVNSTNDFYPASTTAGTYTYSNTFTRGQIMQVIGGAPASAPTIIPCTLGATQSQ